jgi:predicted metal-binding protein
MGTFDFLIEKAKEFGADRAAMIAADQVVVDERVRLKCAVPVCQGYGNYLHCPPNTLSLDEFRRTLSRFSTALVFQVDSASNSADIDGEGLAGKNAAELEALLHGEPNRLLGRIVNQLEAEAFKAGYYYAAGFSGGICLLCPTCVGVGNPCRHPYEARPSMEGVGIDVFKTAANAGLPMALSSDQPVRWTGLLLVE